MFGIKDAGISTTFVILCDTHSQFIVMFGIKGLSTLQVSQPLLKRFIYDVLTAAVNIF